MSNGNEGKNTEQITLCLSFAVFSSKCNVPSGPSGNEGSLSSIYRLLYSMELHMQSIKMGFTWKDSISLKDKIVWGYYAIWPSKYCDSTSIICYCS